MSLPPFLSVCTLLIFLFQDINPKSVQDANSGKGIEEQHMAAETKAKWSKNGESRQLMETRGTEPEGSGGPVWLSPTYRGSWVGPGEDLVLLSLLGMAQNMEL